MIGIGKFDMNSHYGELLKGSLIYSFQGISSQLAMEEVFLDIEQALMYNTKVKIIRKRIFNVLVELIQNIYKYSASLPVSDKNVLIIIQETIDGYEIISGNYLESKFINMLRARANMINYLKSGQIDELYLQILQSGMVTEQQGAGLGFIDVARKSKSKLMYQFNEIDDTYSFFTLKTIIKANS